MWHSHRCFYVIACPKLFGSVGQSLSALCTTSLENCSAVCSFHSLSETVLLFSLTLFGLVSSEHFNAPPWEIRSEALLAGTIPTSIARAIYAFTQWHPLLYTKGYHFVKSFLKFFEKFWDFFHLYIEIVIPVSLKWSAYRWLRRR